MTKADAAVLPLSDQAKAIVLLALQARRESLLRAQRKQPAGSALSRAYQQDIVDLDQVVVTFGGI